MWYIINSLSSDCDSSDEVGPPIIRRFIDPANPPRKRYQRVGLFSDFYKEDEYVIFCRCIT